MSKPDYHLPMLGASPEPRGRRAWRRLSAILVATCLASAALLRQAPVTGAAVRVSDLTPQIGILPFAGDVFVLDSTGALISVNPASTPTSAQLFNLGGQPLNLTWGQFSSATATSDVRHDGNHTDFDITLSGLIPNGVYSLFYRTFGPDSNNAFCPNVEPSVALTALHPDRQQPDADSFVADNSGSAEFDGRVAGQLLDAQQLQVSVIYHFDGNTYGPAANAAESQGPVNGGPCRSSYGIDAMRQFLIIYK